MSKNKIYSLLPYNMMATSKFKSQARKDLPDKVSLKDFVKLCLCIKSPQDYVNLYLFELLKYPKKDNMFKLGTKYMYTIGAENINIVMPINILKGALKLYYDIFAISNDMFIKENKEFLLYEIETKTSSMRFDLVFYIKHETRIKYIKEYHERYHKTLSEGIISDKLEQSYLKLNGTALTIFDFGESFYKSVIANTLDIQIMINMIMDAFMFIPLLRYKLIIQLFEKDLRWRVSSLKKQVKPSINCVYHDKLNDTYIKKKNILEEFSKNKSIEKLFNLKEKCYSSKDLYIISIEELHNLFDIKDKSSFQNYLLSLGFNTNKYAWHQISEMISNYDNDDMKHILDEYYRYLEKNYMCVINMKDEYIKNAYRC